MRSADPKRDSGKVLKSLTLAVAALGALISLGILASITSAPADVSETLFTVGFYIWVALPFALLAIATLSIYRKPYSNAAQLAILVAALAVTSASVWAYWMAVFRPTSSTSALIFVVVPLYSLIAAGAIYSLTWVVIRYLRRERRS